jgi:hypothetical protein
MKIPDSRWRGFREREQEWQGAGGGPAGPGFVIPAELQGRTARMP